MNYYVDKTSIIGENVKIGTATKIWHFCHVMRGAIIGNNCTIGQNGYVGEKVIIGNNVKVQNNVSLYKGVICEDDVFVGPSVVFTNVINPRSNIDRNNQFKTTIVRRGASIGANATIVCGITLGKYCFIGAGAVVTKNVSPYALVVGNPAKQVGWISEHGIKLHFNTDNIAVCRESGQTYEIKEGNIYKK